MQKKTKKIQKISEKLNKPNIIHHRFQREVSTFKFLYFRTIHFISTLHSTCAKKSNVSDTIEDIHKIILMKIYIR